ncbi:MAG: response regulator transcription factor [Alphaproteobacteria bacterium]|nr:response regulator transcription factor [Alphaproteobacteria bacterium]
MTHRKTPLLLIDDDVDLRQALIEQLESAEGFSVESAGTIKDGRALAEAGRASVIILDVDLPDGDGRDACRDMRAAGITTPIIMLTGHDAEKDEVRGLDSGANDYITKPFKFDSLLARIRTQLRIHESSMDAVLQIGGYEFRPAAKTLTSDKRKEIRLTDKETNILKYLYRSGDKPVAREELLREVWGYNANVTTHTLETHIYRLRQKVDLNPEAASIIITEQGGYCLNPRG